MFRYYKLDGKIPVPMDDVRAWAAWLEKADRRVANTHVGDLRVSTVFLGLDHSFGESREPMIFETMIFGMDDDSYQIRSSTWELALEEHEKAVTVARERAQLG